MIDQLKKFYQGKKIFLTGHTGFKGSWLALWLSELGAEVHCYALQPEDGQESHFQMAGIENLVNSSFGDINDVESLNKFCDGKDFDLVFHLAAQALVRRSYKDPVDTFATNIMGTINVFEVVLKSDSIKAFVNITTDKCYENLEQEEPYVESDRIGGKDPYSASKACAELVTTSYRESFFKEKGISLASARAGNTVGGGDFCEDRIIPDIIDAIKNDQPVVLRNPKAIRPWQHVLDVLYGYLILGMKLYEDDTGIYEDGYNISPVNSESIDVESITKMFIEKIGHGEYEISGSVPTLHESQLLRLDSSKAQEQLGWHPRLGVEECMEYTALWYKQYLDSPETIKDYSLQQLQQYMGDLKQVKCA